MLTALRKSFDLIKQHYGEERDLGMPTDDPEVYDMLCKADSVGVFQVESRAQMSMLPRLKPREYYDLVVEVAIVRPGPIQGGMVHPYLKNREVPEDQIAYPERQAEEHPEAHARRAAVPGAGDADRHRLRGLPAGQGRQAAARHGDVPASGHHPQAEGRLHQRHGRQRLRARVRRTLLQADRGLRRVRLPREPCRELRDPGLRLVLGEVLLPRGLRRRPAQLPADGLLCAGPARARRTRARRRGAAARRQCQRLGLHAGEDRAAQRCALRLGFRQVTGLEEDDIKRMVERRTDALSRSGRPVAARRAQQAPDPGAGARRRLRLAGPDAARRAVGGARLLRGVAAAARRAAASARPRTRRSACPR